MMSFHVQGNIWELLKKEVRTGNFHAFLGSLETNIQSTYAILFLLL